MFEISKIYIRSLTAITGITITLIYAIHTGTDTNVILAGFASIIACVLLDKEKVE